METLRMKSVAVFILTVVLSTSGLAAQNAAQPGLTTQTDQPTVQELQQKLKVANEKIDAFDAAYKQVDAAFQRFTNSVGLLTMSPSPLKVRGGSVKAMYYHGASYLWTPIDSTTTKVAVKTPATKIYLDGINDLGAATNKPGEQSYPTTGNWIITVTFRLQHTGVAGKQGVAEDASKKMYICSNLVDNRCTIDSGSPGMFVYFQTDTGTGVFTQLNADVFSEIPGLQFDLMNCGNGSQQCNDTDPGNHIHSVSVDWFGTVAGTHKHHCVDGMCVIGIGP